MARATIILISFVITQVIAAPQQAIPTAKSPTNMNYDELEYILRSKSGNESKPPKTMSPCARAILACCHDNIMNSHCSESLKCGAFFFDSNPCNEKFVLEALKAAKNFYSQFNTVKGN